MLENSTQRKFSCPKKDFTFLCADGMVELAGKGQEVRTYPFQLEIHPKKERSIEMIFKEKLDVLSDGQIRHLDVLPERTRKRQLER